MDKITGFVTSIKDNKDGTYRVRLVQPGKGVIELTTVTKPELGEKISAQKLSGVNS